jgi:hypothetical protein
VKGGFELPGWLDFASVPQTLALGGYANSESGISLKVQAGWFLDFAGHTVSR